MSTKFAAIYDRFLGKITDDMYLEISQEETLRDLQHLLIDALPGFEFPRFPIYNYESSKELYLAEGAYWENIGENLGQSESKWEEIKSVIMVDSKDDIGIDDSYYVVDDSHFNSQLTEEEINIIALLMVKGWLARQINSCEVVRMKYSGTDFKMTSQANHLSKLLSLQTENIRESQHMQRLYKRRRINENGEIRSNWDIFGQVSALGK